MWWFLPQVQITTNPVTTSICGHDFFFVSAYISSIVHVTSMNIINYQWTVTCRVRMSMKLNHNELVQINVTERSFNLVLIFTSPNHHKLGYIRTTPQPQTWTPSTTATSWQLSPFHSTLNIALVSVMQLSYSCHNRWTHQPKSGLQTRRLFPGLASILCVFK